jgi:hypothetical protein
MRRTEMKRKRRRRKKKRRHPKIRARGEVTRYH